MIQGPLTAQGYMQDMFPLMSGLPTGIFQQYNPLQHSARLSQEMSLPDCSTSLACQVVRFIANQAFIGPFGTPASATYERAGSTGPAATSVTKCAAGCIMEAVCLHGTPYIILYPG